MFAWGSYPPHREAAQMSEKYKIIKELIGEWIEREQENYEEAVESAGINCCGACMASGALEAYRQVLSDIESLEQEAVIS
jgi:hypothetical protein